MANFVCLIACALLVAVSAERISPSRDTSSSRDTGSSRDFGFDSDRNTGSSSGRNTGSGSRDSSVQSGRGSTGSRWGDDADAENDFSTPKITAWKGGVIPYEIAPEISANNARALKNMFQDISDKTCVRFVAKRSSDSNYVSIKGGNKCSAPLGMSTGSTGSGRQSSSFTSGSVSNVVLGQSCFTTKRVGRRIMNLLGIPHETSRPDRDQFVEINMANLRTGYANNIKQVATSAYLTGVLDVPYDLQSITQYSDDDLAKDASTWAIRAKGRSRSSSNTQLGGETFSPADFEKIKKAYNCPSSGRSSSSRN